MEPRFDGVVSTVIDEAASASYRVALPEFEGPLDLLLHLCKTNEIDIVNIPDCLHHEEVPGVPGRDAVSVGRRGG